jgi:hypothetical protein
MQEVPFPDWALYLLLARSGDLVLTPETLAAYRVHSAGVHSRLKPDEVKARYRTFYRLLADWLPEKYAAVLRQKVQ